MNILPSEREIITAKQLNNHFIINTSEREIITAEQLNNHLITMYISLSKPY
jgi:hypothetical protein